MKAYKIAAMAVLGAAAFAGATAQAADSPIIGTGYSGVAGQSSGTDAFGNPWAWGTVPGGNSVWGAPGYGAGEATYGSATAATDFEISFVLPLGAAIDTTPSTGPGGFTPYTRFDVCGGGGCVEWTPVYGSPITPHQVSFFAPAGSSLTDGEAYFVNVAFTNGMPTGDNSGFSAYFTTATGVPEPATWAFMLVGAAGMGAVLRRRQARALA